MERVCPYDEITPMSLTGCHQCGFRLICSEYEKALRYKLEMISNSFWRWASNEELLKDITI